MTTVTIVHFTAGWQPVVTATREFDFDEAALAFVNAEAAAWVAKGKATAKECGGVFELDEQVSMGIPMLNLRYVCELQANDGEESFYALLDEASQLRISNTFSPGQANTWQVNVDYDPFKKWPDAPYSYGTGDDALTKLDEVCKSRGVSGIFVIGPDGAHYSYVELARHLGRDT